MIGVSFAQPAGKEFQSLEPIAKRIHRGFTVSHQYEIRRLIRFEDIMCDDYCYPPSISGASLQRITELHFLD